MDGFTGVPQLANWQKKHVFSLGACYVIEFSKKKVSKTPSRFFGGLVGLKKKWVLVTRLDDFNFKGPKPRQVIGRAKTP